MKRLTSAFLKKKGVPKILWPGLLIAAAIGWTGWTGLNKVNNYYQFHPVFPTETIVVQAIDGDTIELQNGLTFRLLGINAPDRGQENYSAAAEYLNSFVEGKTVAIEYDTYQDDKYGRILGYIFLPCRPELSNILSKYCRNNRALINEILIKEGYAESVIYENRRPLKYANYFSTLPTPSPTQ